MSTDIFSTLKADKIIYIILHVSYKPIGQTPSAVRSAFLALLQPTSPRWRL
jgi:hypothetical protein